MLNDLAKDALNIAKSINDDVKTQMLLPSEVVPSLEQGVIPFSYFNRCNRNYIKAVVHQINRTYQDTCYDACSVMIRRLVETLIIEVYEHNGIDSKIKDSNGDFKPLKNLIAEIINEPKFNISRNSKTGLSNMKVLGDLSAHNRRYNAHRQDIDDAKQDLRTVVKELLSLAGLS